MNVIEPERTENLVRADSPEAREGFSYLPPHCEEYSYLVPILNNPHIAIEINHLVNVRNIGQKYVLVFNLKYNKIGFVRADLLVEVTDFTVDMEGI